MKAGDRGSKSPSLGKPRANFEASIRHDKESRQIWTKCHYKKEEIDYIHSLLLDTNELFFWLKA